MGFATLLKRLQGVAEAMPKQLGAQLKTDGAFLVKRARENVPVLTGDLRDSIRFEVKTSGPKDKISGELIAGGSKAPYAIEVHEDTQRPRTPEDESSSTPEGGRGAKFLSRVTKTHTQKIRSNVQKKVHAVLQGPKS